MIRSNVMCRWYGGQLETHSTKPRAENVPKFGISGAGERVRAGQESCSTPAGASSDQEVIVQRPCRGLKLVVACRCESGPGSCQEAR